MEDTTGKNPTTSPTTGLCLSPDYYQKRIKALELRIEILQKENQRLRYRMFDAGMPSRD